MSNPIEAINNISKGHIPNVFLGRILANILAIFLIENILNVTFCQAGYFSSKSINPFSLLKSNSILYVLQMKKQRWYHDSQ